MDVMVRLLHKGLRSTSQGPLRLGLLKGLRVGLQVVEFCNQKQYAQLEQISTTSKNTIMKVQDQKRAEKLIFQRARDVV